jgi:polyhydroxyalkanoate synthesis regulator phasin
MKELIAELVEKAGLTEEQAQKSVDTTVSFVKQKLPPALGDKIEDILSGNFDMMSLLSAFMGGNQKGEANESPLDKLKGMFGK